MARPRKRRSKDLPANLYVNGSYFVYRHPVTGKRRSFGSDRLKAMRAAKLLNEKLESDPVKLLVGKVLSGAQTLAEYIDHWIEAVLPTRRVNGEPLSAETVEEHLRKCRVIKKSLGAIPLMDLSQAAVAQFLNQQSSSEVYNKFRNLLSQILRHAVSDGKIAENLAEKIVKRDLEKKKRNRLELSDFVDIYAASPPWLQRAMELALNIFQRNTDLRSLRFADLKPDGYLYIVQSKTRKHGKSAYLRIPCSIPTVLSLTGHQTLEDIINSCRDDVVCPYILHRKPERRRPSKEKEHWAQKSKKELSKAFAQVRDSLVQFKNVPKEKRPSFYECVSLGMHLREGMGWDDEALKKLKGHTSVRMTRHYLDGHDWTTVEVPGAEQR